MEAGFDKSSSTRSETDPRSPSNVNVNPVRLVAIAPTDQRTDATLVVVI